MIHLLINGKSVSFETPPVLKALKEQFKPEADVVILNGFPVSDLNLTLNHGDEISLICRGVIPPEEELEAVMKSRHTPGIAGKLKESVVGIAGLGGLGSNIAVALARIGVGHLVLADFDVVEPSNLNRQQYFISQLGQPKAQALKETLMRINPYLTYTVHETRITPENFQTLFAPCAIVIEAFDRAEEKAMLIKEGARAKKTIIAASGMAGYGENESIITRKINDSFYLVGDFESDARPGRGLMAPRVMIAAAKQANLAVELILSRKPENPLP